MLEFLTQELREGFEAARRRAAGRKSRLRVQIGPAAYPVLRLWEDGMALDAARVPQLRGRVDVYDGGRHLYQALIVATTVDQGELICGFKRLTPAQDGPALDYCRDEGASAGLLPSS
ncbi:MAG: hypothetical protein IE927_01210 [Rhodobacterales bacterium]|nr:hypothetical protein [Rhodobacterales bacterium]